MRARTILYCGLGWLTSVLANDVLITSSFTSCQNGTDAQITAKDLNIQFDRQAGQIFFDVTGSSSKVQNVTASLSVSAYGNQIYSKDFDPCDTSTKIDQLCPVPEGQFVAQGVHDVSTTFANQIPPTFFSIPDLECEAKLYIKAQDDGENLACIQSAIDNGKTVKLPAISYLAISITIAALLVTGGFVLSNTDATSAGAPSPNFGTCLLWFQSVTTNGMLSVNYPPVYRSFTQNFAFSAGLIPWESMQNSIDEFRRMTGGDLSADSVQQLTNSTFVFSGSNNGSSFISANTAASRKSDAVYGIDGFVEQLTIPQTNAFLTVFLFFLMAIGAIVLGILLFNAVLTIWAMHDSFPKKLASFQGRFAGLLIRSVINSVLIMYGVWTLLFIFQCTTGQSWGTRFFAGASWTLFTTALGLFTLSICNAVRRHGKLVRGASILFEDKDIWRRYSLFYDNYKRVSISVYLEHSLTPETDLEYWWMFMPSIVYVFTRGCVVAAGNGHGLVQTGGQLIVESAMLTLVLVMRPFGSTQGNVINILIHCARVLSVVCLVVFADEMGVAQSTRTRTGVMLIVIQSSMTIILGIVIAINAILICIRPRLNDRQLTDTEKLKVDDNKCGPQEHQNLAKSTSRMGLKNNLVQSHPTVQLPWDAWLVAPRGRSRGSAEDEGLVIAAAAIAGHGRSRAVSWASSDRTSSELDASLEISQEIEHLIHR